MTDAATGGERLDLDEEEWLRRLGPESYHVLREKGTDRPFSGEYTHPGRKGVFRCVACGNTLFVSDAQFDSGSGWPSFTTPAAADAVETAPDHSLGMDRVEVTCTRCGGHLGHVFDDGPAPSGLRYCINSSALDLDEQ
ncbi:MAG TPA: peptide-methionine (R)-S-oxide reductase MsrB [Acidimicrobiales bacterium]|nr:peptide-methionine (R)-S-oxide reductase MsrB [Acidimicrobiales bacterium]